jgi:hypothetical protein
MTGTSFDKVNFWNNDCILLQDGNQLGVLTPIQLVYFSQRWPNKFEENHWRRSRNYAA